MNTSLSKDFFHEQTVFRYRDILEQLPFYKTRQQTLRNLLQYHKKQGNIAHIQKHVYAVIPRQSAPGNPFVDNYLLASKLTDDAVIGYHSALSYHGCLHSVRFITVYLTQKHLSKHRFEYHGERYQAAQVPRSLIKAQQPWFEVQEAPWIDQRIRVTSIERTFVDVLNRPDIIGNDWEEIARSLQKVYLGRPSIVVKYLELLDSPLTASRVGYFIEKYHNAYNALERIIDEIHKLSLKNVTYLDYKQKQDNQLVKKWNLMVPNSLQHSTWEEPQLRE